MILTLTTIAALYVLSLLTGRTTITPDGGVYLAMGRGGLAPRPYAYRLLPRIMGGVMSWRVLHALSWIVYGVACHILGEQAGVNGTIVAAAVLALPANRQSVLWPVLLDIPLMAIASSVAVVAIGHPLIAACIIPFTLLVHERAPFVAALLCLPFVGLFPLGIACVAAVVFVMQMHEAHPGHPDEQRIDWLAHPMKAALAKHRGTWNDWKVWVRPLGASFVGILSGQLWPVIALLFGYAGCMVAQDRARIYTVAALPLTIFAVQMFGHYGAIVPIINWFTYNTEV